jgi:hypothetical protein
MQDERRWGRLTQRCVRHPAERSTLPDTDQPLAEEVKTNPHADDNDGPLTTIEPSGSHGPQSDRPSLPISPDRRWDALALLTPAGPAVLAGRVP